jgi:hypothetical protein
VSAVALPAAVVAGEAGPDGLGLGWVDDDAPAGPATRAVPMGGAAVLPMSPGGVATLPLPFDLGWAGGTWGAVDVYNDGWLLFDAGTGPLGCAGSGDWVGVAALGQPWSADAVATRTVGRYPRRTVVVDWAGGPPGVLGGGPGFGGGGRPDGAPRPARRIARTSAVAGASCDDGGARARSRCQGR